MLVKNSILIVDDQEINRVLIAELFREEYNIFEAENGKQALEILEKNSDIAAVMLDLIMPVMDGMEVLFELNRTGKIYHIPVFIITAADNTQMLAEAYGLGAVDIIPKPFRMIFIKSRIENIIELYRHRNELVEVVEDNVGKINKNTYKLVESLAALVEFRDGGSSEHEKQVRHITKHLMTILGAMYPEYEFDPATVDKISIASVLHDIGKIAVSDSILKKPEKLTDEEFEAVKTHTTRGCDILAEMPEGVVDQETFRYCFDICRYHHERWDGSGYPDGLSGNDIPIWAQAVGLADVYSSLISPRVYRDAFDSETALQMIRDGKCGSFNPKLLKAWEKLVDEGYFS